MVRVFRIEEPDLFFGGNEKCLDPQVGLLNYGPHGGGSLDPEARIKIRAGLIGTNRSLGTTEVWLSRLRNRIQAEQVTKTEYKGIDFPGLSQDGPLRFGIEIDENCVLKIDRSFVRRLKEEKSRKKRILMAVQEYCARYDDMLEAHPPPQIILLPIDDALFKLCKDPHRKTEKIIYQQREFGDPDAATAPLFDFHHYLKAQAAVRGFVTQLLTPGTLVFSSRKQSAALIAWNFAVAAYYKATGIPWKLAEIDNETCYIGVSFYQEGEVMRASIAQVYMRTGESQVIRGEPFEWDQDQRGRSVHLESSQMAEVIRKSVNIYERQRKRLPQRVVVHKSTVFFDEEIEGCERACNNIDELDIIHLPEWNTFRAYHEKYSYPVVRGTTIGDSQEAMLFSTGYVPALGTYPGPAAPAPLHLTCQRLDTSLETACWDILGLTKLDWNTSTFYRRMPVTIGVSGKVGDIMAEMRAIKESPPNSYKFYM